jgi:L-alanine-DL-glutamate epimerase-like enolase superfamily enzyme
MQITDVKATLHRIPIEAPLLKEKIWTPIVFTAVETDQGITGYGLTRAAQRFGAKEFIIGRSPHFYAAKIPSKPSASGTSYTKHSTRAHKRGCGARR